MVESDCRPTWGRFFREFKPEIFWMIGALVHYLFTIFLFIGFSKFLEEALVGMNIELPLVTRMFLASSAVICEYYYVALPLLIWSFLGMIKAMVMVLATKVMGKKSSKLRTIVHCSLVGTCLTLYMVDVTILLAMYMPLTKLTTNLSFY